METGSAWFETAPGRWVCEFDRHAIRDILIDWTEMLVGMGESYGHHTVIAGPMMQASLSSVAGNITTDRVQVAQGQSPMLGREYPITWRLVTTSGQCDDLTLWFRIVER